MQNLRSIFELLFAGNNLTARDIHLLIAACLDNSLNDCQIAAFLSLMRMKGETIEELTAASQFILERAKILTLGDDLIDIVGTGGDGKNTFNISTISAIVAAAAGARVAKHGSHAFSSNSGSVDFLKLAGIKLFEDSKSLGACLKNFNLCFLFAPYFHKTLAQVSKARKDLGFRTFFNFIGPLLNPARVRKQVIGVANPLWQKRLAEVLVNLGSKRVLAIHSRDGMDEVSIADLTDVIEYHDGKFTTWALNPRDYSCYHSKIDGILVDSPKESLSLAERVFKGESGAARDAILLNAGLAIYLAFEQISLVEAINKAKTAIDSGKALTTFNNLIEFKYDINLRENSRS